MRFIQYFIAASLLAPTTVQAQAKSDQKPSAPKPPTISVPP